MSVPKNNTPSLTGHPALVVELMRDGLAGEFQYDPKREVWFQKQSPCAAHKPGLWVPADYSKKSPAPLFRRILRHGLKHGVKTSPAVNDCITMLEKMEPMRNESFDSDDLLVGLPNGLVVDFNKPHHGNAPVVRKPKDGEYISKCIGASLPHNRHLYANDFIMLPFMIGPKWHEFLRQALPDFADLLYMQIVFGMGLIGDTRAQVAHVFQGPAATGKSVALEIYRAVAGEYHALVESKALTTGKDEHPTWLAQLAGARAATEDDLHNKAWTNEQFKRLTSGGEMQARFLYGDYFPFKPKCDLAFTANENPKLSPNDDAMRRRLRIVPFHRQVPMEYRNQDLVEELLAELPLIAAWALEGAFRYLRDGLPDNTPAMAKVRKEWLKDEVDPIGDWLSKHVEARPGASLPNDQLKEAMRKTLVVGKTPKPIYNKLRKLFPNAVKWRRNGKYGHDHVRLKPSAVAVP